MKRNSHEIKKEILEATRKGSNIFNVVCRVKLNDVMAKSYLADLVESGYIRKEDGKYFTTEMGIDVLRKLGEIRL